MSEPQLDVCRSATSVRLLLTFACEIGLDPQDCVRAAGVDPAVLTDGQVELPLSAELTLIQTVVQASAASTASGLRLGSRYHLTAYGIYGFALTSSRTFAEAMRLAERYFDLNFALSRVGARRVGRQYVWRFDGSVVPATVARFIVGRDLAAALCLVTDLLGVDSGLIEVRFTEEAPKDVRPFVEVCGPNVRFGMEHDALVFDASIVSARLPQANPDTSKLIAEQCEDLLERRRARVGLAGQVRRQILRDPARFASMEAVADDLGLSTRTLRRRLTEDEVSFRDLVGEARQVLAAQLLAETDISIEQAAYRLGYQESTSFITAFRRWTGMTPASYRRAQIEQRRTPGV